MDSGLRKRRRPAVSCSRCRRRKVKCDRKDPCSRCRRTQSVCTYNNNNNGNSEVTSLAQSSRSISQAAPTLPAISTYLSPTSSTPGRAQHEHAGRGLSDAVPSVRTTGSFDTSSRPANPDAERRLQDISDQLRLLKQQICQQSPADPTKGVRSGRRKSSAARNTVEDAAVGTQ
ncbi:hypothetical protein VTN96DRAFT_6901 [Rasamsonia emersonii]